MPIVFTATTDQSLYVLVFIAGVVCGIALAWPVVKRRVSSEREHSGASSAGVDVERLLRTIRTYM